MIKEIQRRPMIRPLLCWIAGILLQTVYPLEKYTGLLLTIPLVTLSLSYILKPSTVSFSNRWFWGIHHLIFLFFLSVQLTSFHQKNTIKQFTTFSLQDKANTLRQKMVTKIETLDLNENEKAVLSTITLGDRKKLSSHTKKQFAMTGAAHMLAVSGMHVAIVCGFFTFLLTLVPYRHRWRFLIYLLQLLLV